MEKRSLAILLSGTILLTSYATLPVQVSAATELSAETNTQGNLLVTWGVNLRDKPSTSGKVIKEVKKGAYLTLLKRSNDYFYKVRTSDGKVGYISSNNKYTNSLSNSNAPAPSISDSRGRQIEKVISVGKKYLGTPYEFGSNRNTIITFDCSDFVRQAYKEALGIILPADSRKQGQWIKNNGTAVYNIDQLKRGDIVFFMSYKGSSSSAYSRIDKSKERITHDAIYLGDGYLLQTYSKESGGVRIDKMVGTQWEKRFLFGGSVLK